MSDVSSVTKYFPKVNEGFITAVSGTGIAAGASVIPITNVSGLTNGSVFVGIIEPSTANQQTFTGTIDTTGSQITGVVWTRGTNVPHATNAQIVDYVTGTAINMISAGITQFANINGTLKQSSILSSLGNSGAVPVNAIGSGYPMNNLYNPYKFSVWNSTNDALPANTAQKVNFTQEEFDTSNNFDSVTNQRFTAPVTGFYSFSASIRIGISGIATGKTANAAIYKNGSLWKYGQAIAGTNDVNTLPTSQINILMQLNAGDYIEVWAYTSDTSRNIGGGQSATYFSGFLVSAT